MSPLKFVEKIYNYEITPDEAIEDQEKLEILISRLKNYKIKKLKKKNRREILESAVKLFCVREDIISFSEKGTFPYKGNVFKIKKDESEDESEEEIKNDY